MALALELSKRDGLPQKPQLQSSRPPSDPERSHHSPHSAGTNRSFSSAPFYNYSDLLGESPDDEDDEDLQMAMAYSLSELEAQQRAAATDCLSGARGGVKVKIDKTTRVRKVNTDCLEKDVQDKKDEGQFRVSFTPESPSTSNSTPSSASEVTAPSRCSNEQCATESRNSSMKKKKECGCILC